MQIKKKPKMVLSLAAILAGTVLALIYLLPLLLPFLLGYLVALMADPAVRLLSQKTPMPRWLCSGICITVFFGVLGVAMFFLCRVLWGELVSFVEQLPALLAELEAPMAQIRSWLEHLTSRASEGVRNALQSWLDSFFEGSSVLVETVYRKLASLVSGIIMGLPKTLLSVFTVVLSAYMISAGLPELKLWLKRRLPEKWRSGACALKDRTRTAVGGWLIAQLKLMGVTFGVITLGLWVLRTDFALLIGAVIALVDALPVLGAGMVLIPWGLIAFLQDRAQLGVGLLVLYGLVALTRTTLEPRLVGRQLGLPPLVTLLAFYAGFRLMGIAGMILFPICAILVKQFWELLDIHPTQAD